MRGSPSSKARAHGGPRRFRLADITVQVPFEATDDDRICLLRASGVPLDEAGEITRGFLFERTSHRPDCCTILRWFDEDSIGGVRGVEAHDEALPHHS